MSGERELRPLVVFGGGALGNAVARLAAARGAPVTVASRHAKEHVGWWRHTVVGSAAPLGWLPARADVVIAIAPGAREVEADTWNPALSAWITRLQALRPASVVLTGPIGSGPGFTACAEALGSAGGAVVRFPALLAAGTGWAGNLAAELRSGKSPRVSTALPDARALAADDAARVVLAALGENVELTVTGPTRLSAAAVVEALSARYGVATRARLFGTGLPKETVVRLQRELTLPDQWDESRFGPRLSLSQWAERLPGPRRRRAEN